MSDLKLVTLGAVCTLSLTGHEAADKWFAMMYHDIKDMFSSVRLSDV